MLTFDQRLPRFWLRSGDLRWFSGDIYLTRHCFVLINYKLCLPKGNQSSLYTHTLYKTVVSETIHLVIGTAAAVTT